MAETQETVADIIAEMREARPCNAHCDDYECEKNAGGVCRAPNPCLGYEEAGKVLAELEAAKRELAKSSAGGDAAKLREAMCEILSYIERFHKYVMPGKGEKLTALFAVADTIRNKARAALAEPPRQCDVGSAKEQEDRFNKYCRGSNYCAVCPIRKLWDFRDGHSPSCTILWSQMPCEAEEGGAE